MDLEWRWFEFFACGPWCLVSTTALFSDYLIEAGRRECFESGGLILKARTVPNYVTVASRPDPSPVTQVMLKIR